LTLLPRLSQPRATVKGGGRGRSQLLVLFSYNPGRRHRRRRQPLASRRRLLLLFFTTANFHFSPPPSSSSTAAKTLPTKGSARRSPTGRGAGGRGREGVNKGEGRGLQRRGSRPFLTSSTVGRNVISPRLWLLIRLGGGGRSLRRTLVIESHAAFALLVPCGPSERETPRAKQLGEHGVNGGSTCAHTHTQRETMR